MKSLKYFFATCAVVLLASCSGPDEDVTADESSLDLKKIITEGSGERQMGFCENRGFLNDPAPPEGSLCTEFVVLPSTPDLPWAYWYCVIIGDNGDEIFTQSTDPDGKFEVCFEKAQHYYTYTITYINALGETLCESINEVWNEEACAPSDFHLCWGSNGAERSMQAFRYVGGIIVTDNCGNESKSVLFDPELLIVGQEQNIFDAFQSALVSDHNLDPSQVELIGSCEYCKKGTTTQLNSYAVYGAAFQKIIMYGTDKRGKEIEVEFYPTSCD